MSMVIIMYDCVQKSNSLIPSPLQHSSTMPQNVEQGMVVNY